MATGSKNLFKTKKTVTFICFGARKEQSKIYVIVCCGFVEKWLSSPLFFPPFMPPCSPVLVISTTPPRPNVFSYVCGLRVSQGAWPEPRVCLPGSDFNFCQFFSRSSFLPSLHATM